jgi:taurine transport system substrate-binding protein
MRKTRRGFLKFTTALAAAGALPLVPGVARAAVVANYGGSAWLGHYPAYIAMKTGIFSRHGIDLRWQSFGTSSARLGAVMAGNIDVGGTGVVSALSLMAGGAKQFQIISTPDDYGRSEGLLVRADVNSLAGLKGKKVGVTYASSSHVLLLDVLKQASMDPGSDVSIINLPAPELLSAFRSGQIDAAVTWTPTFDKIAALPGTKVLMDDTSFSLFKQYRIAPGPDVLFVRSAFASAHPEAVKGFLLSISEANQLLIDKPEACAKALVELTQLPQSDQLATIRQTHWYTLAEQKALIQPTGGKPSSFVEGLQKLANMLVELKQIDSAPRVQDWIQTTYL